MDEDWEVIGVESGEGAPLGVYGNVGLAIVRSGEEGLRLVGRRVFVKEQQVGICEGVVDVGHPICSSEIGGLRVAGGMVGVEISHDNGVIMGLEE